MRLIPILEELIIENILDTFIEKNVGDDKPISNTIFDEIKRVANGKVNYILWLSKSYINNALHSTDIYKFEEFISIFEKNKNKYQYKDINQYKTKADIDNFMRTSIEIRDEDIDISKSTEVSDKYVSIKDIKRLKDVGIKFHGIHAGYQLFEVPNKAKDNNQAFNRYNEILGKCANRDAGEKIDICTFQIEHFQSYLNDYKGSSYFVLYNLGDPDSPYQIHYESNQFKDKNDKEVREVDNPGKFIPVIKYIEKLRPNEYQNLSFDLLGFSLIRGEYNANGEFHGNVHIKYDDREEIGNYKNGLREGLFKIYYTDRMDRIERRESEYINNLEHGIRKQFYENGDVDYINFWEDELEGSWITENKNGVIIYSATYEAGQVVGKTKVYYPDGNLKEEIDHTNNNTTFYYKDGKPKIFTKYGNRNNSYKQIGYSETSDILFIKKYDDYESEKDLKNKYELLINDENGNEIAVLNSLRTSRVPSDKLKSGFKLIIKKDGKDFISYAPSSVSDNENPFRKDDIINVIFHSKPSDKPYKIYKSRGFYVDNTYRVGYDGRDKTIPYHANFLIRLYDLAEHIYNFMNLGDTKNYSLIKDNIDYVVNEVSSIKDNSVYDYVFFPKYQRYETD